MFIAHITGNLGRDAEARYTNDGKMSLTFSVAVSQRKQNRETKEWEDHTEWFRIFVMRNAENLQRDAVKGAKVCVVGPATAEPYTNNKDGKLGAGLQISFPHEVWFPNRVFQEQAESAESEAEPVTAPAASPAKANGNARRQTASTPATDDSTDLDDLPFHHPRWMDEPWMKWYETL